MDKALQTRTDRAKELIKIAKHACMATTNEDGTPHATPFYLILDENLHRVYFGSHPDSLHSQNVVRTGNLFVVIYDMVEKGGLYMKAINGKELSGAELREGLRVHNATRARHGKPPIERSYYEGGGPQRMFGADLVAFWINAAEQDAQGQLIRDYRQAVTADDLLR